MGEVAPVGKIKHGAKMGPHGTRKPTPEYLSWRAAKLRCLNVNHVAWRRYGGKGISMCERWRHSFVDFLSDMGARPPGTSLDRIDNTIGYEPGNCRWATRVQQAGNTSMSRLVVVNGQKLCLAATLRVLNLEARRFTHRFQRYGVLALLGGQ